MLYFIIPVFTVFFLINRVLGEQAESICQINVFTQEARKALATSLQNVRSSSLKCWFLWT